MNKTLILGWGKSGESAAGLLLRHGGDVVCFDDNGGDTVGDGIENRRGMSLENVLEDVGLVVVNPAVPVDHPVINGAKAKGIEVIGEIELASRYCQASTVAVTGTNGKTTTVSLIKAVLDKAGIKACALGNIGVSFSSAADSLSGAVAVLEISSFQLETAVKFAPGIAVCLNVTPDHIERHGSFQEYARVKAKIFDNQKEDDFAVLNRDDPVVMSMGNCIAAKKRWFSLEGKTDGAYLDGDGIYYSDGEKTEFVMRASEVPLKGRHNLSDVLAAVTVCGIYGVDTSTIAAAVREFRAPRYRTEYIGRHGKLKIYNDSKATNIDSTLRACSAMDGRTVLIMGGWDKKISYGAFFASLPSNVVHIVCCGDNSDEIIRWADEDGDYSIVKTATLERAVGIALSYNDVENLLFSPSTSSFDRYTDYMQRGRHFDGIVKAFANV